MKKSQYSISFPYKGAHILFNTRTQKLLILTEKYVSIFNEKEIDFISSIDQSFFDVLVKTGNIIDDNLNEYNEVVETLEKIDNDETMFHVIINPTLNCNFNCWYCYENHDKPMVMAPEILEKTKTFLHKICSDNKFSTVKLSFFGGEPLLQYERIIKPLLIYFNTLRELRPFRSIIHFTTNGYLLNNKRILELKNFGVNSFQITLDGNQEKHDSTRHLISGLGSYERIINNIDSIIETGMYVILRINYTSDNFNSLQDIFNHYQNIKGDSKHRIIISLNQVWQDKGNLSESEIENLHKSVDDAGLISLHDLNDGRYQYACYADKRNQAVINYDGLVYKCNARDFTTDNSEGILDENGEIIWNENFSKRMSIRFKNPSCTNCYLLPLCNGGCRQYALEHSDTNYCVFEHNDHKKIRMIKSLIFSHNVTFDTLDNIIENQK